MKEINATIIQRNIQATIQGGIIKGEKGEQGEQAQVDNNLVRAEIQSLVNDFINQIDLKSLKGEKGEKGEKGLQGEVDYNLINEKIQELVNDFITKINLETLKGKDGVDGKNGLDGQNGQNGLDGQNGLNGRNGIDGRDGRDAEFDYDFAKKEIKNLFKKYTPDTTEDIKTIIQKDNDYKINEEDIDKGDIDKKIKRIFDTWKKDLGNFKGEKGERGAYGPQGPQGLPGPGITYPQLLSVISLRI